MAMLSLLLSGHEAAWRIPELHGLRQKHAYAGKQRLLELHFHMIGPETLESKLFSIGGDLADMVAKRRGESGSPTLKSLLRAPAGARRRAGFATLGAPKSPLFPPMIPARSKAAAGRIAEVAGSCRSEPTRGRSIESRSRAALVEKDQRRGDFAFEIDPRPAQAAQNPFQRAVLVGGDVRLEGRSQERQSSQHGARHRGLKPLAFDQPAHAFQPACRGGQRLVDGAARLIRRRASILGDDDQDAVPARMLLLQRCSESSQCVVCERAAMTVIDDDDDIAPQQRDKRLQTFHDALRQMHIETVLFHSS